MDLRSLELDLVRRQARAVLVTDGAGTATTRELGGAAFDALAAAAAPLVAAIAPAGGPALESLSLEFLSSTRGPLLRAEPGPRLEGEALAPHARLVAEVARAVVALVLPARAADDAAVAPSEASFWERLYREAADGWELGRAAPPLARWIATHPELVRGARALVVGCGRGHEARALARAGATVVGVDFALDAITAARALAAAEGVAVDFRQRDLFSLADDPDRYDLVVEHTCFCAIDPARRDEYADVIARILAPGGLFVALFYAHGRPGGPPFGASDDELAARFAPPRFTVVSRETPADSVATRAGDERLIVLRRQPTAPTAPSAG